MPSKPEIEGEKLLKSLVSQNVDYGGAFVYITGGMGGGKTSAMFSLLEYTRKFYPNQKIFLSETYDAPLQCFKLGLDKCRFLVKEGSNVIFRDRNKHLAKVEFLPITYFKSNKVTKTITLKNQPSKTIVNYEPDFDDLWKKSKYGKVNVVFFGDRGEWAKFVAFMRHKGEWCHVFVDEIGEILPAGTSGNRWQTIGEFGNFAKDIRKCMIKVITNTQSVRDLDYRIVDKFMYRIFLPGAMQDKKHSRIVQRAIDNLTGNEKNGNTAYIDRMGTFGLIIFDKIFKPDPRYSIEAYIKVV